MDLRTAVEARVVILTEGALIERLRRDATVALDPHVLHAGFIYDERGRDTLRQLYRQYLDIGAAADLPMIVCTPTWRASLGRLQRAGLAGRDVNGDGARFLSSIRGEYGPYAAHVWIGGLVGCMGDAYKPAEGLSERDAANAHAWQVKALASAGVDFLLAATLPNAEEARGIAVAMSGCGLPYVLSFVLGSDGRLLDGTPLYDAVATIDAAARPRPLFYMLNCVHPTVCERAFTSQGFRSRQLADRVIGLQANASARSPEELDGSSQLDAEPPETLADAIFRVHRRFGTRVLGGCCGTDHRHIARIARRATESGRPMLSHRGERAQEQSEMSDLPVGVLKKTLAAICSRCPICNHARAHPDSWLGRVLHHPLHADHCPFWKAEAATRPAEAAGEACDRHER